MVDPIMRPRQVCRAISWSRTTLWRRIRDGHFPKPLRLGGNAIGWRASTVDAYLDGLTEAA